MSYRMMAAKLGISHNAVKIALNNEPGVSDETRQRVVRLARKLGYPGLEAFYQATVAAYIPDSGPVRVGAQFIVDWLHDHAIRVVSCPPAGQGPEKPEFSVLLYFHDAPEPLQRFRAQHPGIPVIVFFTAMPAEDVDLVLVEGIDSLHNPVLASPAERLCREFLEQIHKRIQMLAGTPDAQQWTCISHRPPSGRIGRGPFSGSPLAAPGKVAGKTTISDIARKVGCSTATVSNALQGKGSISDQARRRITETAWNEGYRQVHSTKKDKVIIVFDQWPLNPSHIFNNFCSTLNDLAMQYGDLHISHVTTLRADFLKRSIHNMRPDGVILFYDRQDLVKAASEAIDPIIRPAVSLVSPAVDLNMDSVLENHADSVRRLLDHFAGQGCHRFGYLGTDYPTGTAHLQRFSCFNEEIRTRGFAAPGEWQILFSEREARKWSHTQTEEMVQLSVGQKVREIMRKTTVLPDAVICYNDSFAVALDITLRELGIDNIKISGWGNQTILSRATRPITTVDFNLQSMAEAALNLICSRIEEPYAPLQTILLNSQIVQSQNSG